MTEEEKRAHALHAGLKILELFKPDPTTRTVAFLVKYTMLAYNWINTGAITNSDVPLQNVEAPYQPPAPKMKDVSARTATKAGG